MLKNYILTAIRSIWKHKVYSLLNILGLAIGIACSLLIFLYIRSELAYDKFYQNSDNIYRLAVEYNMGGKIDRYCNLGRPVGPTMQQEYPEILEMTRVAGIPSLNIHTAEVEYNKQVIISEKIFAADTSFFKVFSNKFVLGDSENPLRNPDAVVITERFADKLFGEESPLGKTITINENSERIVTAVIADLPAGSHLEYEVITPWNEVYRAGEENVWYGWHVYTYILLQDNHNPETIISKFDSFFDKYMVDTFSRLDGTCSLILQPLTSIHLNSNLTWEAYPNGRKSNIYIFSIIAVFLLLIASINYMNLATARSEKRGREVGLRKVFGSCRSSLIKQFLTESIIVVFIAMLIAVVITELVIPHIQQFFTSTLEFDLMNDSLLLIELLAVVIIIGTFSGLYPAFFLSSYLPSETLKGPIKKGMKGSILRKVLIVIQFTISIVMIISTIILLNQIAFAKNKDIGFSKENTIAISIKDQQLFDRLDNFTQEISQIPGVLGYAVSDALPGKELNHITLNVEDDDGNFAPIGCQFMSIDENFAGLLGLRFTQGNNFAKNSGISGDFKVIVNETAAVKFGWGDNAIGKRIFMGYNNQNEPINVENIGVINDFQIGSIREFIQPIVIFAIREDEEVSRRGNWLFVKMSDTAISNKLKSIEKKWNSFTGEEPLEYIFLDESYNKLYASEDKLSQLFTYFSILTLIIACLGLLGLSAYSAEQRTKEIGVRKVLGASVSSLIMMLCLDFSKWVLIANVMAWPLSWFLMNKWLMNFAYHIDITLAPFVISACLSFVMAMLTVVLQSFKVADANPIDALKYQ